MKKAVWTLNADGKYNPAITGLTYPLMKHFSHKIKADFNIITTRKFPDWPVSYEKLQIHELGRPYDWNLYLDGDTLVHTDMFDPTDHIHKDTVLHNGQDMAGNRWRYDEYFRRDGRHIGSCNWLAAASNWCLDLWRPLELTLQEALNNIFPIALEAAEFGPDIDCFGKPIKDKDDKVVIVPKMSISREHLIDDYALSRNIARYGLKFTNIYSILAKLGNPGDGLWHLYQITNEKKIKLMKEILGKWGIPLIASDGGFDVSKI